MALFKKNKEKDVKKVSKKQTKKMQGVSKRKDKSPLVTTVWSSDLSILKENKSFIDKHDLAPYIAVRLPFDAIGGIQDANKNAEKGSFIQTINESGIDVHITDDLLESGSIIVIPTEKSIDVMESYNFLLGVKLPVVRMSAAGDIQELNVSITVRDLSDVVSEYDDLERLLGDKYESGMDTSVSTVEVTPTTSNAEVSPSVDTFNDYDNVELYNDQEDEGYEEMSSSETITYDDDDTEYDSQEEDEIDFTGGHFGDVEEEVDEEYGDTYEEEIEESIQTDDDEEEIIVTQESMVNRLDRIFNVDGIVYDGNVQEFVDLLHGISYAPPLNMDFDNIGGQLGEALRAKVDTYNSIIDFDYSVVDGQVIRKYVEEFDKASGLIQARAEAKMKELKTRIDELHQKELTKADEVISKKKLDMTNKYSIGKDSAGEQAKTQAMADYDRRNLARFEETLMVMERQEYENIEINKRTLELESRNRIQSEIDGEIADSRRMLIRLSLELNTRLSADVVAKYNEQIDELSAYIEEYRGDETARQNAIDELALSRQQFKEELETKNNLIAKLEDMLSNQKDFTKASLDEMAELAKKQQDIVRKDMERTMESNDELHRTSMQSLEQEIKVKNLELERIEKTYKREKDLMELSFKHELTLQKRSAAQAKFIVGLSLLMTAIVASAGTYILLDLLGK